MKLKFLKDYRFSPDGSLVITYKAGDIIETDDKRLVEAATADGAAKTEIQEKPQKKAK